MGRISQESTQQETMKMNIKSVSIFILIAGIFSNVDSSASNYGKADVDNRMIGGDVADQSLINEGPDISILTLKKPIDMRAPAAVCFDRKPRKCRRLAQRNRRICENRKYRRFVTKYCRGTCEFC